MFEIENQNVKKIESYKNQGYNNVFRYPYPKINKVTYRGRESKK